MKDSNANVTTLGPRSFFYMVDSGINMDIAITQFCSNAIPSARSESISSSTNVS
jgi:hypothetical protein